MEIATSYKKRTGAECKKLQAQCDNVAPVNCVVPHLGYTVQFEVAKDQMEFSATENTFSFHFISFFSVREFNPVTFIIV